MANKPPFFMFWRRKRPKKDGNNAHRVQRRKKADVRTVTGGVNAQEEDVQDARRETGRLDRSARPGSEEIADKIKSQAESSKPEKGKNAPKLTAEQREMLLEWLAAGYSPPAMRELMSIEGIPSLTTATMSYYRTTYGTRIAELRTIRYSRALSEGLSRREERVERLKKHADDLETIKWVSGETGRLYNEKAWRETLDQIAEEVGDKAPDDNIREIIIKFAKKQAAKVEVDETG